MNFLTMVCTRCKARKSNEKDYHAHDGWRDFRYDGDRNSSIHVQLCPDCFLGLRHFLDGRLLAPPTLIGLWTDTDITVRRVGE